VLRLALYFVKRTCPWSKNMDVAFKKLCLGPGEPLDLTLSRLPTENGARYKIDVFRIGVLNPHLVLGQESAGPASGTQEVSFDTARLPPGLYEVRAEAGNANLQGTIEIVDRCPATPLQRLLFEVAIAPRPVDPSQLLEEARALEQRIEHDFLEPVEAVLGLAQAAAHQFVVFVFVRGMLLGTRMRFERFEIVPAGNGITNRESLDFVNSFLKQNTATGIQFPYTEERALSDRQANPVAVFHFPAVRAPSSMVARDYARAKTEQTLLALALVRDASGEIFDSVVVEPGAGMQAVSYARAPQYRGNFLSGWLAGENPSSVEAFSGQIGRNSADAFLATLYKEARREPSQDFQYVRLWAILEALADAREYDGAAPLLNFEGHQLQDGDRLLTLGGGAVNRVYALLREVGIGSSARNWKHVNAWFGFRTAAAHHGSRERHHLLTRATVRALTAQAWAEIASAGGHDSYLWEMKEDVKLLLMRRLNRAQPWQPAGFAGK